MPFGHLVMDIMGTMDTMDITTIIMTSNHSKRPTATMTRAEIWSTLNSFSKWKRPFGLISSKDYTKTTSPTLSTKNVLETGTFPNSLVFRPFTIKLSPVTSSTSPWTSTKMSLMILSRWSGKTTNTAQHWSQSPILSGGVEKTPTSAFTKLAFWIDSWTTHSQWWWLSMICMRSSPEIPFVRTKHKSLPKLASSSKTVRKCGPCKKVSIWNSMQRKQLQLLASRTKSTE